MKLKKIYSNRFIESVAYMDIVQEWEDDFSESLNIPIVSSEFVRPIHERIIYNKFTNKVFSTNFLKDILQKIDSLFNANSKSISFELYPVGNFLNRNSVRVNNIPIIIDFWKHEDTQQFYNVYKNCEIIFITSLEVLNYLKQAGFKIPLFHLPLSLPNKYKSLVTTQKTKSIDIVLAGRRDEILGNYLKHFCARYKDVEYVYQVHKEGNIFYESNKKGIIGNMNSREDYWNLINSGLVSFYSTPGMDDGVKRTGGFNPVTPRYFELLAANCFLLGRYPKNEETDFFELEKVCPNVVDYEHFETVLLSYLNKRDEKFDFNIYQTILNKHYTSNRVNELLGLLNVMNEK